LFEEKERAQVTLNSIGDAVISTNFSGRVNYLNIVAEKMTGWVQLDAAGSAVDEIFRLVDTTTHETIPCPTAQAIIENRRISLKNGDACSPGATGRKSRSKSPPRPSTIGTAGSSAP